MTALGTGKAGNNIRNLVSGQVVEFLLAPVECKGKHLGRYRRGHGLIGQDIQQSVRSQQMIPHHLGDAQTGAQGCAVAPLLVDTPLQTTQSFPSFRRGAFDEIVDRHLTKSLELNRIIMRDGGHGIEIKTAEI